MNRNKSMLLMLLYLLSGNIYSQSLELIQVQRDIASKMSEFNNGYGEYVAGENFGYDNRWNHKNDAFLSRANNGKMFMEWYSDSVKHRVGKVVKYLLLVGSDQDSSTQFSLYINENEPVKFKTRAADWRQVDPSGVVLEYTKYASNDWGDGFGFMTITVPASKIEMGIPTHFKLVGDKQESNHWFMVFKNKDLLHEVAHRAQTDQYYKLRKEGNQLHIETTSEVLHQEMEYQCNQEPKKKLRFSPQGRYAGASIDLGSKPVGSFTLYTDGRKSFAIANLSKPCNVNELNQDILTQVLVKDTTSGREEMDVQRSYSTTRREVEDLSKGVYANAGINIMVSSHQDIAWMDAPYKCVEERDRLIVSPALDLMQKHSDYRYNIEDGLIIEEYLQRHPDKKALIGKLIADGQLEVGAAYTQPYEESQTGEALTRQFYYGKRWLEHLYPGIRLRTYWNVDVPGRTLQMAQILKKSGVDYLMFSRFATGLYEWYAPDSSHVLAFTPGHYGDAAQFLHAEPEVSMDKFVEYVNSFPDYRSDKRTKPVLGMLSAEDMSEAHTYYNWMHTMAWFGKIMNRPVPSIVHATASQFMDQASASGARYPQVIGERPEIWEYIHGPSHELSFTAYRKANRLAVAAETFCSIESLLANSFSNYPSDEFRSIWKSIIYPDHGWGGNKGFITDSVFHAKYVFAAQESAKLLKGSLAEISHNIKFDGRKGSPIVVYNALSWMRTEPVRLCLAGDPKDGEKIQIRDAEGGMVDFQVDTTNDASHATTIEFVGKDIPPIGYRSYYLTKKSGSTPVQVPASAGLDTKFYRVSMEEGQLKQIYDKELNAPLFNTDKFSIGDVVCMESVGNGAGEFSSIQKPSMNHYEQASLLGARWTLEATGPVYTQYQSTTTFKEATIVRRMRIYKEVKKIDFFTDVLGFTGAKYLEFRQMFPLTSKMSVAYDVPFGTVTVGKDEMKGAPGERYKDAAQSIHPRSISNWIGASDGEKNVMLSSSVVVNDYVDPTDPATDKTVLQPILFASRRSCNYQGDFYYQRGDHHFQFSITSSAAHGKPLAQSIPAITQAISSNNPLLSVAAPRSFSDASLPESRSFFSLDQPNVFISTIKKAEDDDEVVVRMYDAIGEASQVKLSAWIPWSRVSLTNLIEEQGLPYSSDRLSVGAKSIETYKFDYETISSK